MNENVTIDFRDPIAVRDAGMNALKKELGIVGTSYFLRQFASKRGDYTLERELLLDNTSSEEIAKGIYELQSIKKTQPPLDKTNK